MKNKYQFVKLHLISKVVSLSFIISFQSTAIPSLTREELQKYYSSSSLSLFKRSVWKDFISASITSLRPSIPLFKYLSMT